MAGAEYADRAQKGFAGKTAFTAGADLPFDPALLGGLHRRASAGHRGRRVAGDFPAGVCGADRFVRTVSQSETEQSFLEFDFL